MIDARTPIERLDEAAVIYASACENRAEAMAGLKRRIRECDEVGLSRLMIAAHAGISRQTVYDALQGGQP